jgi:excisionase family DNA binding protein
MARRMWQAPEVADRLDVNRDRVYELTRLDILPHIRIGRQYRYDPDAIEAWIARGGEAAPGSWRTQSDEAA